MAETNEPKKETVRIKLPPRQTSSASNSDNGPRDTIRINLPSRAPSNPSASSQALKPPPLPAAVVARAPVLPGLGQPPKAPSFPVPSIAEPLPSPLHSPSIVESSVDPPLVPPAPPVVLKKAAPVPLIPPPTPPMAASPGPRKETARIAIMPEPRAAPATVKMSKTQPLITAPEPMSETAPISIEPEHSHETIESIPVPLCWALVGISALIFIIQVWTYFS